MAGPGHDEACKEEHEKPGGSSPAGPLNPSLLCPVGLGRAQNTPSTMAPTNKMAAYAVTTLSLLTKVMEDSLVHVVPALTLKRSNGFPSKKVRVPVYPASPQLESAGRRG
jgi:hypothetical protein